MDGFELLEIIKCGETSHVQFKREFDNQDSIAAEMIAFANSKGGMIVFGVEDKIGKVIGFDYEGLQHIGNKVSMVANELVKPQINIFTEIVPVYGMGIEEKKVLIVQIDEGTAKPYKDRNGITWVRRGPDKRKVTDNNEILRLFQQSHTAFVDEMTVAKTTIDDVDKGKVDSYVTRMLKDSPNLIMHLSEATLYENLGIIENSALTLGGLLFFAKWPQRYRPGFCVKAVSFFGNDQSCINYKDSRDMIGTIPELFKESMAFFNSNLRHVQRGQNFNSTGILEISYVALEELVQNALIHRDYTWYAPVRLFIFDNRVEIISPGSLPNNLTVEKIKLGTAAIRNNLLVSYASKVMTYRGVGTGIIRAQSQQPNIEFINDEDGNRFIVKIPREPMP